MLMRRLLAPAVLLPLFALAAARDAPAGVVFRLGAFQQTSSGTGSFEVIIANKGGGPAVDIAGFSFQLSVPDPAVSGVVFQGVSTQTVSNPYIFNGIGAATVDSNFQFSFDAFPNSTFVASDTDFANDAVTLGPDSSFGLGLVTYSFDPGGSGGSVPVSFVDVNGAGTSLSDGNGNAILFTAEGGSIELQSVPEPSTLAIGLLVAACLGLSLRRRASVAAQPSAEGDAGSNPS